MDYIIVRCRECGKWNHVVVETKYRDATQNEHRKWYNSAGPKRVIE